MLQFRTFEETITLIGAIVIAAIAYKLTSEIFAKPLLASGLVGFLFSVVLAFMTSSTMTLQGDAITYRSMFGQTTFPVSEVERVGVQPTSGLLPGKSVVFIMRRPPSKVNGLIFRTGVLTWPSVAEWVDAVNAAVRRSTSNSESR